MARKKTTKKSSNRDPERADRNKRIMIGGAIIIGAGAVFVGAAMGIGELDRRAAEFIMSTNPPVVIDWPTDVQGTTWMPMIERERIQTQLARAVQGGKALSRAPLEEAGLALMRSGWIEGTPRVRWTSEGKIEVQAHWRVPVAAVRVGTREIVIDRQRHALPLDYNIGQSNQLYFVHVDARQPAIGEQWRGTDIEDGLELLFVLEEENLLEQVAGFDLGQGEKSGTIRIITTRNSKIIWGAGPGRERPGEVPTSVKTGRLKIFYEKTGLIDGGFQYIDISGPTMTKMRAEG